MSAIGAGEEGGASPSRGKSWGPVGKSGPVKSAGGAGSAARASPAIARNPPTSSAPTSTRAGLAVVTLRAAAGNGSSACRAGMPVVTKRAIIGDNSFAAASLGKTRLFYRPIFDPKLCEERNFRRSPDAAFCRRSENLAQSGLVEPTDAPLPGKTDGSWRARGTPTANCDPAYLADRDAPRDGAECPVVPNTPIRPRVRDRIRRTRRARHT